MPDRPKGEECVGSGLEGAPAPPFTQLIVRILSKGPYGGLLAYGVVRVLSGVG